MPAISLAQAQEIISGAFEQGKARGMKPLTVAVLDAGGHLIALARQDRSSNLRPEIAIGKASGALDLGISSRAIGDMASERPGFLASLGHIAPNGLIPAAGGVLITDSDGATIGAAGVTGDLSDNDELCVLAGIKAAGLQASQ